MEKGRQGSAKNKQVAELAHCSGCRKAISDDIKALQCDNCNSSNSWRCCECLNLTDEVYEALLTNASCNLNWFCEDCEQASSCRGTMSISDNRIDGVMALLEKFLENFNTLDVKLNDKADKNEVVRLENELRSVELKLNARCDDIMKEVKDNN